jgi:hypothetical protein
MSKQFLFFVFIVMFSLSTVTLYGFLTEVVYWDAPKITLVVLFVGSGYLSAAMAFYNSMKDAEF